MRMRPLQARPKIPLQRTHGTRGSAYPIHWRDWGVAKGMKAVVDLVDCLRLVLRGIVLLCR